MELPFCCVESWEPPKVMDGVFWLFCPKTNGAEAPPVWPKVNDDEVGVAAPPVAKGLLIPAPSLPPAEKVKELLVPNMLPFCSGCEAGVTPKEKLVFGWGVFCSGCEAGVTPKPKLVLG